MQHTEALSDTQQFAVRTEIDRLQRELDQLKKRLGGNSAIEPSSAAASQRVREVIRRRRERERLFGDDLFFDPAWDILLDLFQAHTKQQRSATSELARAAGIPPTTTLRWIAKLESSGWIIRKPDPLDARRVFIELTLKGREAMQSYFED